MSKRLPAFLIGLLAGLAVAAALVAFVDPINDLLPDHGESRTDEARRIIQDSYFRETDDEELQDASIDGMVRKISKENDDKFSHYFNAEAYQEFQEANSGRFSGIGLSVSEGKRGLEVVDVFPGSPAQDADIAPGDVIVAVEGDSLRGVSADEASARIKGEPGTEVEITVVDGETDKKRTIDVERAEVTVPAVQSKMLRAPGDDGGDGAKIGYVHLSTFSRGAHAELRKKIEDLQKRGAEGLIFDLRGNGGGLLEEAVLVTSIFQDEGPVVTIEGRERDKKTFQATGDAIEDLGPVAVLVDGNTASASEITSAALQENDLATIIGSTTYGKGVFQEVIELDGGGALDITVGEYLTADGSSILGVGVIPDEKVADKDLADGDDTVLDAGLKNVGSRIGSDGGDGG
ncbi:MAG: S41 family peptidase [Solirubrobacterales bacterium]|nr:S41 family peptidase [Solirubrobacterales bacterium]